MKATIYNLVLTDNFKVVLENGEVWFYKTHCGRWKPSKYTRSELQCSTGYIKLATVNNFKMLHKLL